MRVFDSISKLLDRPVVAAIVTASALGAGMLVLQRWVAETRGAAIVLVVAWFALVLLAALWATRDDFELRRWSVGTIAAIAAVTIAVGYWTGFRETTVDEEVAVATTQARGADLERRLSGEAAAGKPERNPDRDRRAGKREREADRTPEETKAVGGGTLDDGRPDRGGAAPVVEADDSAQVLDDGRDDPSEPEPQVDVGQKPGDGSEAVELASAPIRGADGHAAEGTATVVEEADGTRILTLTEFEADPGPDVDVYLSTDSGGIDDAINLGDLKGTNGDQQYAIPAGADLTRYRALVLWCIPFTTRIATADLVD